MKCKHMHKDEPENAICEDCYAIWSEQFGIHMIVHKMKGGQDDNKNN